MVWKMLILKNTRNVFVIYSIIFNILVILMPSLVVFFLKQEATGFGIVIYNILLIIEVMIVGLVFYYFPIGDEKRSFYDIKNIVRDKKRWPPPYSMIWILPICIIMPVIIWYILSYFIGFEITLGGANVVAVLSASIIMASSWERSHSDDSGSAG